MILGTIQYPSRYSGLGEGVRLGLQYMAEHDLATLSPGKYQIDGDNVCFEVAEIQTVATDKRLFETHKEHIDIHITLEGEEWFGYAPVDSVKDPKPYNAEKDSTYYENGEGVYLQAPKGQFILFMPEDAHKAGVFFHNQGRVKKIVIKVKI
ncbi:MAG: YhcH/YjgK/YiaL family protein [Synergistaceae bacterium]|nr:YhcH/YjgK/YiaL family protein [Synergistaceae bacterium]